MPGKLEEAPAGLMELLNFLCQGSAADPTADCITLISTIPSSEVSPSVFSPPAGIAIQPNLDEFGKSVLMSCGITTLFKPKVDPVGVASALINNRVVRSVHDEAANCFQDTACSSLKQT